MLLFPNAKINIGLRILRRRPDGYHDIESVMVPVGWCDVLEMVPAAGAEASFTIVGNDTLGLADAADNLVVKALRALEAHIGRALPPLDVYLSKVIPTGAGLGGGSADAAFAIRGANELCGLGLSDAEMASVAARVGADCPFFIYNRPMLATGIGERLEPVQVDGVGRLTVVIAKPAAEAVSTRMAYAGVVPSEAPTPLPLAQAVASPAGQWQVSASVFNDFERSIFALRPQIALTKERMLAAGALYAAMSGSGAAVFGIFDNDKMAEDAATAFAGCDVYVGTLGVVG